MWRRRGHKRNVPPVVSGGAAPCALVALSATAWKVDLHDDGGYARPPRTLTIIIEIVSK